MTPKDLEMKIKLLVNNPWQENTIVLYDETGEAVVIDCGCLGDDDENRLKKFMADNQLHPVALLNTHLHPDHMFGNNFMKDTYGLETQASEDDAFLLDRAVEYAAMLGIRGTVPPPPAGKYLKDGDVVKFGNSQLKVIAVAGHSPGGLCFYSEPDKLLIAGDVLFAGSVGRSDLPGGDGDRLIKDIKNKLFVLPDDVIVVPGHGPNTRIGDERRHNPFFA